MADQNTFTSFQEYARAVERRCDEGEPQAFYWRGSVYTEDSEGNWSSVRRPDLCAHKLVDQGGGLWRCSECGEPLLFREGEEPSGAHGSE